MEISGSRKTLQVLNKTDIAVLIIDSTAGLSATEETLISRFRAKNIPFLLVYNKIDLNRSLPGNAALSDIPSVCVSAKDGTNIHELKERIAALAPKEDKQKPLVSDLLKPLDLVLLVIPIDKLRQRDGSFFLSSRRSGIFSPAERRLLLCGTRNFHRRFPGFWKRNLSPACDYRQPGFPLCSKTHAGTYPAYFFFDSVCQIQGKS